MDRSNCERVREALWPLERPRAHTDEASDALAHVEACAPCRAFFRRDARLGRRLEGTCLKTPCPEGMRERVCASIDAAPSDADHWRPGRRVLPWAIGAATILLAAVGILRPGPRDLEAAFVQDYRSRAAAQTVIESPDIDRVAGFFLREMGFAAEPLPVSSGEFTRAQICFIDGQRAAMVEYRIAGHTVAHYRVPVATRENVRPVHSATEDGVCVVRWSDGRYAHALVADIPEPELRILARQEFGASP